MEHVSMYPDVYIPTYTIERLTIYNTWSPWAKGFPYQEASCLCYNVIAQFEMEVCRMVEEKA